MCVHSFLSFEENGQNCNRAGKSGEEKCHGRTNITTGEGQRRAICVRDVILDCSELFSLEQPDGFDLLAVMQ